MVSKPVPPPLVWARSTHEAEDRYTQAKAIASLDAKYPWSAR